MGRRWIAPGKEDWATVGGIDELLSDDSMQAAMWCVDGPRRSPLDPVLPTGCSESIPIGPLVRVNRSQQGLRSRPC